MKKHLKNTNKLNITHKVNFKNLTKSIIKI